VTTPEIHSYDAVTAPRGMLKHIFPILGYPKVIASNTEILANFFRRDLLGRFRGSFLGIFWVLIQPIFMFAIYFFVFGYLFAPRMAPGAGPNVEFALYLFSGIIAFSSFSESTTRSCGVVLENGNLVKKVRFPCELLPIPNVLVAMITYLVGAVVFLIVGFSFGMLEVGPHTFAWPLVILVHAVMSLGFGLILACLQVLIRDTAHLYAIASQAWFFLSPVFWFPRMLEEKLGSWSWVLEFNPMYPLVHAHRQALGFTSPNMGLMVHYAEDASGKPIMGAPLESVWYHTGIAAIWAFFFLFIGYSFFTSRKNKFSDLV
jgi:lipopolysaccharide transport system permease protein